MYIRPLKHYRLFVFALVSGLFSITAGPQLLAANPPGTTLLETIDLSPGADAYFPFRVAINHSTHKLYAPGGATGATSATSGTDDAPPGSNYGVKVIDTTNNRVIAGIDLGRYDEGPGNQPAFKPLAIAVDSSAAPLGNRIYVVGSVGDDRLFLRVIDGDTDTNETDQSTDLLLPITGFLGSDGMDVNPVNHEVYVAVSNNVIVIDGPNLQVLTTLKTFFPSGLVLANPVTGKIFTFAANIIQLIDGSTDVVGPPQVVDYSARAVALASTSGQVFVIGTQSILDSQLHVLDGTTGTQVASQADLPSGARALTVDSSAKLVYVGQPTSFARAQAGEVTVFDIEDLSPKGTYPYGAGHLGLDGTGSSKRLYIVDFSNYAGTDEGPQLQNMVGALDPADASLTRVAVAYSPGQTAVNPGSNLIYVADEQAPELTVLDGVSRTVLARIATAPSSNTDYDAYPILRPLAVSVALNRIYLSRTVTASRDEPGTTALIDIYDGVTTAVIDSITVSTAADTPLPQVAIDDTRRRLYASATAGPLNDATYSLQVYDLNSNALISTIPTPQTAGLINAIGVNPVTGFVYVAGSTSSAIQIIDPTTNTIVDTAEAGAIPGPIAVDIQTNRIFVANIGLGDNSVTVINGVTGESEATIANVGDATTDGVTSVAVDHLTHNVYVGDDSRTFQDGSEIHGVGRVTVFDGTGSYGLLGQLDVGKYPSWVSLNTRTRQLFASNNVDGTISVLENDTPAPPDRLANISTRLGVLTGEKVLIGGFIITGPADTRKDVLVRGLGPSLTALGVAGALGDPLLELHGDESLILSNDNWQTDDNGDSQKAAIEATGLAPTNDLESAILIQLAPGSYTAILRGVIDSIGVGLVEVYDLTASDATKMGNISTRGQVDTGDNVMIGGVIIAGANPSQVIVRAIGPTLADAGVGDALLDPVLELHDPQGALITTNDNWKDDNQAEIEATMLAPKDDRESAIVATLYPSPYTAIVRGKDDTTGVGLVEVYYLQ